MREAFRNDAFTAPAQKTEEAHINGLFAPFNPGPSQRRQRIQQKDKDLSRHSNRSPGLGLRLGQRPRHATSITSGGGESTFETLSYRGWNLNPFQAAEAEARDGDTVPVSAAMSANSPGACDPSGTSNSDGPSSETSGKTCGSAGPGAAASVSVADLAAGRLWRSGGVLGVSDAPAAWGTSGAWA